MTLSYPQKALLRLIDRSPKDENGFAGVSDKLKPHVNAFFVSDLMEAKEDLNLIRLTENGKIILKYLD